MNNRKRIVAAAMSCVAAVAISPRLIGCGKGGGYDAKRFNELTNGFALFMLGNDAFTWNVCSVTPYESYGYVKSDNPHWYSYVKITQNDVDDIVDAFTYYKNLLKNFKLSTLSPSDAATYRSMEYTLNTYLNYYGSAHAVDFDLIGGSYIGSQGGYVADFASAVENYSFRTENDVKDLLAITVSTKDAFGTYLDFAADRVAAGYPLYDYSIESMQDYLDEISDSGDDYYLYEFLENKIDAVDFLSDSDKQRYKSEYDKALTDGFMAGVRILSDGLDDYTGHVKETQKSYLAAYGNIGKEYYRWCFSQKTGETVTNSDMTAIYNDMIDAYFEYLENCDAVVAAVDLLEETDKTVYDDFNAYLDEEKPLLGLKTPQEILAYLKEAAKKLVPDLKTEPEIDFKYMDETVAKISNTLAYYLHSPMDEENSPEHITLNGFLMESDSSDSLTTIAHEGYPGHLYAYVNAKENGSSLLSSLINCSAFAEGWAKYTELAILDIIAADTDDAAVAMYCEYKYNDILASYISMFLYDMQINYFGNSVQYYVGLGADLEYAQYIVETFMEIPSVYVSYGYGMYFVNELHNDAKAALGDKYSEIEFNGALLGEGVGPTLERAKKITDEFIVSAK